MHRGRGAAATPLGQLLQRDPSVAEALYYAATRHARSASDADDLFQETLRVGLTRRDPPDVRDLAAVKSFFGSILNGLAVNQRRAARRRTRLAYDDDAPPSSSRAVPHPERALLEREEEVARQKARADLRAHLAAEPLALAMWDLAEQGVRGVAELVRLTGRSEDEVRNAQRRITYHGRRLRKLADAEIERSS
jgi:DNA-directed RNA polymerase specialized sigma24 family protein